MALQGLYQEATAENEAELQRIMKEYDAILESDPSNMVCQIAPILSFCAIRS